MFDHQKNYSDSFVEIILEEVNKRIDLKLESNDFQYVKNDSYTAHYLRYIVPGNEDITTLIALLKVLKGNKYMLLPLPWDGFIREFVSKEDFFESLIVDFNPSVREELNENREKYISKMIESTTSDSSPLLFNNLNELHIFLESDNEDILHYFVANLLLFPLNLEWFLLFDYDLYAIHFVDGGNHINSLREVLNENELIYSENQIEQLKIDARE